MICHRAAHAKSGVTCLQGQLRQVISGQQQSCNGDIGSLAIQAEVGGSASTPDGGRQNENVTGHRAPGGSMPIDQTPSSGSWSCPSPTWVRGGAPPLSHRSTDTPSTASAPIPYGVCKKNGLSSTDRTKASRLSGCPGYGTDTNNSGGQQHGAPHGLSGMRDRGRQ